MAAWCSPVDTDLSMRSTVSASPPSFRSTRSTSTCFARPSRMSEPFDEVTGTSGWTMPPAGSIIPDTPAVVTPAAEAPVETPPAAGEPVATPPVEAPPADDPDKAHDEGHGPTTPGDPAPEATTPDVPPPAPDAPATEAPTPASPFPAATTPAALVLRDADGSTASIAVTSPAVVVTTPSPTVIIPDAPPAPAPDAPGSNGSEDIDPAMPPGFRDAFGSTYLLGVTAGGVIDTSIPGDPVSADAPTPGPESTPGPATPAASPSPESLGTGGGPGSEIPASPAMPPLSPGADQPGIVPGDAPPTRTPAVILPPAPVRVATTLLSAAALERSAAQPRVRHDMMPKRVAEKALETAGDAGEVTAETADKAAHSPWLPVGLLGMALLYLLGQRALDRGSKLSYAGRAGDPDDELIEL